MIDNSKEAQNLKEAQKKVKDSYELHVRLLQRTGMKIGEARIAAWLEGPAGLKKMLAKLD